MQDHRERTLVELDAAVTATNSVPKALYLTLASTLDWFTPTEFQRAWEQVPGTEPWRPKTPAYRNVFEASFLQYGMFEGTVSRARISEEGRSYGAAAAGAILNWAVSILDRPFTVHDVLGHSTKVEGDQNTVRASLLRIMMLHPIIVRKVPRDLPDIYAYVKWEYDITNPNGALEHNGKKLGQSGLVVASEVDGYEGTLQFTVAPYGNRPRALRSNNTGREHGYAEVSAHLVEYYEANRGRNISTTTCIEYLLQFPDMKKYERRELIGYAWSSLKKWAKQGFLAEDNGHVKLSFPDEQSREDARRLVIAVRNLKRGNEKYLTKCREQGMAIISDENMVRALLVKQQSK